MFPTGVRNCGFRMAFRVASGLTESEVLVRVQVWLCSHPHNLYCVSLSSLIGLLPVARLFLAASQYGDDTLKV